jgi:hypothetical protein
MLLKREKTMNHSEASTLVLALGVLACLLVWLLKKIENKD